MNEPQRESVKQTPLHATHRELGARMVEFGGWDMPVMYTSIGEEHAATRNQAGLFDLCHMGRLDITGKAHKDFLQ